MKDIPGCEGLYAVTQDGKVWSHRRGRFLKPFNANGYRRIWIKSKTCAVHRLVARTYIPNPNNLPCINHLDSNKANNRVENLEWCTHRENTQHSFRDGRRGGALTKEQVLKIREHKIIKLGPTKGSKLLGVNKATYEDAYYGRTYKNY